jgi:hypothetical protein
MDTYKFSFVIKPPVGIAITKHIEFAERETCIAISCDSSDGECTHLLEPEDNAKFIKSLGVVDGLSVIEAVKAVVSLRLEALVDAQVHAIVKPDFVWYDFDSPFYGDVYVESISQPDGTYKRIN